MICVKKIKERRHAWSTILIVDTINIECVVLFYLKANCSLWHHSLVVVKVRERERLAMSKQTTQTFHMERFNLEIEGKEQHQLQISNTFVGLKNLDDDVIINRAWEIIRENIKF